METQNTGVTVYLRETNDEKTLPRGIAPFEELNDELVGWPEVDIRLGSDDVPAVTRAKFNPSTGEDLPAKTRDWTRKRMKLQPGVSEYEMVDYAALAENSQTLPTEASTRRATVESPTHGSVAWVLAILAIIGFLTAMLMVGIAISV
jgi:hypothetical protein